MSSNFASSNSNLIVQSADHDNLSSVWDDTELEAEYNKIDVALKDHVAQVYEQRYGSSSIKAGDISNKKVHHNLKHLEKKSVKSASDTGFSLPEAMIPPILNPPHVFENLWNKSSDQTPKPTSPSLIPPSLAEWKPVLEQWYRSGYELGKAHALKLKAASN